MSALISRESESEWLSREKDEQKEVNINLRVPQCDYPRYVTSGLVYNRSIERTKHFIYSDKCRAHRDQSKYADHVTVIPQITSKAERPWYSYHQCLDVKCPIHPEKQELTKIIHIHNGHNAINTHSTGKRSINDISKKDKQIEGDITKDPVPFGSHSVQTTDCPKRYKTVKSYSDSPGFICSYLRRKTDINRYPLYKKSIECFLSSFVKRNPRENIIRTLTPEVWHDPSCKGCYRRYLHFNLDHHNIWTQMNDSTIEVENPPESDYDSKLHDTLNKYKFIFDHDYVLGKKGKDKNPNHDINDLKCDTNSSDTPEGSETTAHSKRSENSMDKKSLAGIQETRKKIVTTWDKHPVHSSKSHTPAASRGAQKKNNLLERNKSFRQYEKHTLSSSTPHTPSSSKPPTPSSSKPHTPNSSKPHILNSSKPHNPSASKPHISNSSKPPTPNSSKLHSLNSSKPHTPSASNPDMSNSSKLHTPNSSKPHSLNSSKPHTPVRQCDADEGPNSQRSRTPLSQHGSARSHLNNQVTPTISPYTNRFLSPYVGNISSPLYCPSTPYQPTGNLHNQQSNSQNGTSPYQQSYFQRGSLPYLQSNLQQGGLPKQQSYSQQGILPYHNSNPQQGISPYQKSNIKHGMLPYQQAYSQQYISQNTSPYQQSNSQQDILRVLQNHRIHGLSQSGDARILQNSMDGVLPYSPTRLPYWQSPMGYTRPHPQNTPQLGQPPQTLSQSFRPYYNSNIKTQESQTYSNLSLNAASPAAIGTSYYGYNTPMQFVSWQQHNNTSQYVNHVYTDIPFHTSEQSCDGKDEKGYDSNDELNKNFNAGNKYGYEEYATEDPLVTSDRRDNDEHSLKYNIEFEYSDSDRDVYEDIDGDTRRPGGFEYSNGKLDALYHISSNNSMRGDFEYSDTEQDLGCHGYDDNQRHDKHEYSDNELEAHDYGYNETERRTEVGYTNGKRDAIALRRSGRYSRSPYQRRSLSKERSRSQCYVIRNDSRKRKRSRSSSGSRRDIRRSRSRNDDKQQSSISKTNSYSSSLRSDKRKSSSNMCGNRSREDRRESSSKTGSRSDSSRRFYSRSSAGRSRRRSKTRSSSGARPSNSITKRHKSYVKSQSRTRSPI